MSEHHEVGADFNSGLVGEASTRVARDFSCVAWLSQGGPPAARGTGPFPRLAARVRCCCLGRGEGRRRGADHLSFSGSDLLTECESNR
jgi:hypothetical protein